MSGSKCNMVHVILVGNDIKHHIKQPLLMTFIIYNLLETSRLQVVFSRVFSAE